MTTQSKSALVTGARTGLGAAIARALAKDGVAVGVGVRKKGDGAKTVAEISAAGGNAREIILDVGESGAAKRAVEECASAFGGLDILVNNAAVIEPIGAISKTPPEDFARNLHINMVGAFALINAAWPLLKESRGRIVNIISGASRAALLGWASYCSSKSALLMLTQCADLEGKPEGVRCFAFAPGLVDTAMQETIRESGVNEVSKLPRSALAHPDIPARAAAFLASGEADDLAGQYADVRDPDLRARAGLDPA